MYKKFTQFSNVCQWRLIRTLSLGEAKAAPENVAAAVSFSFRAF